MFTSLLRLACICVVIGTMASCAQLQKAIKQPKVSFESLRLGDASSEQLELIPRLTITNLNSFAIPLQAIDYNLKLNDRNIFDGAINKLGELKPNKAKSVDIPVRLSQQTFDFFVNSLFENKQINYSVGGNANLKGIKVPFTRNGTFFLPQVNIGKIDFDELSLDNISANLPIEIINKNEFDLPFKALQYSISNKGKEVFANSVQYSGISKDGATNLNIPFQIKPGDLVTSSLQLLQSPTIQLNLKAFADLGFTRLPFDKTTEITLR